MLKVNVINSKKLLEIASSNSKKYFCVSTDKAANPVSLMGASKKLMEDFLCSSQNTTPFSSARFANVAFSNGSLLQGFQRRIEKKQPIACPSDIERYFMTPSESGELCLISCLFGENMEVFFPKVNQEFKLEKIQDILLNFLKYHNLKPYFCVSEQEAKEYFIDRKEDKSWPCLLTPSDTSGEKLYEEFTGSNESIISNKFQSIGIIALDEQSLNYKSFLNEVNDFERSAHFEKKDLVQIFYKYSNNLSHISQEKNLDDKM
jgi:FlaA1/EpsC-like NDP-sugar epimerase